MILKKIYERKLKKYREKLESEINNILCEYIIEEEIREMAFYGMESGRRFRPLLFLLSYKIFNKEITQEVYRLASAIEFLHKASLVHDDLLDGDKYRRGKITFHHKYGSRMSILTGDLLVSMANNIFLEHVSAKRVLKRWAELYRLLVIGEIKDISWEKNRNIEEEKIREMLYQKTASFLEFVMEAGAYLASSNEEKARIMGEIGRELGFAFQIMNDLNNWAGVEKALGREAQGDLNAGKNNLVTLLVRKTKTENQGAKKEEISIQTKSIAAEHINKAGSLLKELGINNRYTLVLSSILNDYDQKWFWVDIDGS